MKQNPKHLFHKFWNHLPLILFLAAVLGLSFVYGLAVGKWHVFPYKFLNAGWDSLKEIRNRGLHEIHPARYEGQGVVLCEPEQVFPGVTLIAGAWRNGDDRDLAVRLIDLEGRILHQWVINPEEIWQRSPHNDYASPYRDVKRRICIHGSLLLPCGDIIFNLDCFSLVRLTADSEVVWKLPYRTHHSIFQDDEGKLWVCGTKWREERVPDLPGLKPPFVDDMILKVSLDGNIEREMSVLQILYKSGYYNLIFAGQQTTGDILHLNDIEVLGKRQAHAFDAFEPGDIMVSSRHLYAVFVIDAKTERVKWFMTYPFIDQHDPDFTDDGNITVFDNHLDMFGGSRILSIEPSTRQVEVLYGHKKDQYFFTFRCGKHQHLPNGNILITEAQAGRIFEVTKNGKVVWDWLTSRWDKDHILEILDGTRYGEEFTAFLKNGQERKGNEQ
jgi:hypothetical protein